MPLSRRSVCSPQIATAKCTQLVHKVAQLARGLHALERALLTLAAADEHPEEIDQLEHHSRAGFGLPDAAFSFCVCVCVARGDGGGWERGKTTHTTRTTHTHAHTRALGSVHPPSLGFSAWRLMCLGSFSLRFPSLCARAPARRSFTAPRDALRTCPPPLVPLAKLEDSDEK